MPWWCRLLVMVTLASLLVGCGYHLRGAAEWPASLDTIEIKASRAHQALVRELTEALQRKDVTIVGRGAEAKATIVIMDEQITRRVATLTTSGTAEEYELHYLLQFAVKDAAGQDWLEDQTIELRRVYGTTSEQVLAKSEEEQQLQRDMRLNVVQQLMLRVTTKARQH